MNAGSNDARQQLVLAVWRKTVTGDPLWRAVYRQLLLDGEQISTQSRHLAELTSDPPPIHFHPAGSHGAWLIGGRRLLLDKRHLPTLQLCHAAIDADLHDESPATWIGVKPSADAARHSIARLAKRLTDECPELADAIAGIEVRATGELVTSTSYHLRARLITR